MKATAATAINNVASHPITVQDFEILNRPMMRESVDISISKAMTGTATTPLITAAHISAFTGLSASTLAAAPRKVAMAIAA